MYEAGTKCNSGKRDVSGDITLSIDGVDIEMVPFVKNILKDTITAVVKELNGYSEDALIEIKIGAAGE
ncbi:MAG: hypothetical protein LBN35_00705 [Clostridiales Family XIII bacterium]|jgi:hypothetical protein|nr:hypothetical protein [Clostridiales Family XIII bacterium]